MHSSKSGFMFQKIWPRKKVSVLVSVKILLSSFSVPGDTSINSEPRYVVFFYVYVCDDINVFVKDHSV